MKQLRHFSTRSALGVSTWILTSLAVGACAGTETGNPVDGGHAGGDVIEGVPVGGECELAATELDWEEDWGPGFSGADVAAHLPEALSTTLRWVDSSSLAYGPESGLGEVELSIEPRHRAYVVGPESSGGDEPATEGPIGDLGAECARTLHVESEVRLTSSGGALDDTFLVTLQTRVFVDTVHAHFRVPIEELQGDLEAEVDLPEGQSLASPLALEVEMWLSPAGLTGALRIAPEVVDESDVLVETAPLALGRFPAEQPCGLGSHLLEPGEALHGFSPDDVLQRLTGASDGSWVYEHQEGSTQISWQLPSDPPTRCVGVEQTGVEFLAPLTVTSDDGSVDGTFTVNVHAQGDAEGGYSALQMAGGAFEQDVDAAHDLGERYGLTDPAPLDGYDGGMTDFIVDVTGAPWGVFRYAGLTQDPCTSDGSQSCQGLVPTVLFGAHLGEPKNGYELEPAPED